jgi:hypothetical protein
VSPRPALKLGQVGQRRAHGHARRSAGGMYVSGLVRCLGIVAGVGPIVCLSTERGPCRGIASLRCCMSCSRVVLVPSCSVLGCSWEMVVSGRAAMRWRHGRCACQVISLLRSVCAALHGFAGGLCVMPACGGRRPGDGCQWCTAILRFRSLLPLLRPLILCCL